MRHPEKILPRGDDHATLGRRVRWAGTLWRRAARATRWTTLLLALALLLVSSAPALAEPVVVKPMMIHTVSPAVGNYPYAFFTPGQTVECFTTYMVKGLGAFRVKFYLLDHRGDVVSRFQEGPLFEDEPGFQVHWWETSFAAPAQPGYYTLKVVYVDTESRRTWSHWTRIRVAL